ncbi:hypothetical protein VTJ83DRAFT_7209 [Remersonia thermophila]|uniref:HTH APSES-type domain-containing protein n=1 Tax=Remersonia thermophila TaxID=72144 RepID=A0ABR4D2U0_9PEZI
MESGGPGMYYQSHMSAGQPSAQQTVTSPYTHQQHPHQQPPLLQPGPSQYPSPHYGSQYYPTNALPPAPGPSGVSNALTAPPPVLPLPGPVSQPTMGQSPFPAGFDTTGQIQPPGMKPRVTATLWEDEGSLCFQVEARGICVARREDNHMINGTKLLNVAGMTRGRRDGILKSEKLRHVVKIGPMHLKGVWIPFERALDFANKEKITELLYPLFVHNIGALLCHPTNQSRNQVMAAAHRKHDALRPPPPLPALHHPLALPGPQGPLSSHPPPMARPSIDRTQSFPTPPASASTVMGGMNGADGFQWNQQSTNQISIDTRLNNNGASLPNTSATTPPGSSMQSMQSYPAASQPYDNSRQMYQSSAPQTSSYPPPTSAQQERSMYGHSNTYVKSEMAPPASRTGTSNGDQADTKPPNGDSANAPEEEADHEHDGEYTHDSGAYDTNRGPYNYSAPPVNSIQNDHSHLASDISGSPHQTGSGRATPRTAAAPQPYYTSQGYNTPPRVGQTSSNLYSVMSNERSSAPNGSSTNDVYGTSQGDMTNGYSTAQPTLSNGTSLKRGRDDDDDRSDLKRHKSMMGASGPMNSPTFSSQMAQPAAAGIGGQRRR